MGRRPVFSVLILVVLLQSCCGVYKDVAWLIDVSSSLSATDHGMVIDFIYNVTTYLTIGSGDIRMAVVTFDVETNAEFELDDNDVKSDLLTAINRIPVKSKRVAERKTMDALTFVNTIFLKIKGGREDADKIIVVIVTGTSTNTATTISKANNLRNKYSAEVFVIGIGGNLTSNNEELKGMANDPDSYYLEYMGDFINLCGLIPSIVPKIDNESIPLLLNGCVVWEEPTTVVQQTTEENTVPSKINTGMNTGAVVAVILSCLFILALLACILFLLYRRKRRKAKEKEGDSEQKVARAVKDYNEAELGQKRFTYKRDMTNMSTKAEITNPIYENESRSSVYENLGERSVTHATINVKVPL